MAESEMARAARLAARRATVAASARDEAAILADREAAAREAERVAAIDAARAKRVPLSGAERSPVRFRSVAELVADTDSRVSARVMAACHAEAERSRVATDRVPVRRPVAGDAHPAYRRPTRVRRGEAPRGF